MNATIWTFEQLSVSIEENENWLKVPRKNEQGKSGLQQSVVTPRSARKIHGADDRKRQETQLSY
jgi:hypothetical protein